KDVVFFFHGGDAADARADDDTAAVRVFAGEVEAGVFDGVDTGAQGITGEGVDAFDEFVFDGFEGIEFGGGDFAADADGIILDVGNTLDGFNAGVAFEEAVPDEIEVLTQGSDDAQAGDNDATFGHGTKEAGSKKKEARSRGGECQE